ncbi:MAG TPA: SDR family oxidoreductase [Steroidobacteraceae bacterium]|jgi:short-subunit dehydrogenase
MKRLLIIGATSAIAEATARLFAARGDAILLVGRDAERLNAIAEDLKLRGAGLAVPYPLDLRELQLHSPMLEAAVARLGGIDMVLIAHGTLSDQLACQASPALMVQEFTTNAISTMALCTLVAERFQAQRRGVLCVIASVAADRGRRSNYVYGAAKAAVVAFASGLRQRLYPYGVSVVTIKPGFVDTPMTRAHRKNGLWATPATVAGDIVRAMDRGTPVVYTPWFWRPIMAIIRGIPETIFRRLKL